jgi:hypothetical protein
VEIDDLVWGTDTRGQSIDGKVPVCQITSQILPPELRNIYDQAPYVIEVKDSTASTPRNVQGVIVTLKAIG